jgi:hypothetical protein
MSRPPLTIRELIKALESYPPDAEVRIAHQPMWPFEYGAWGVISDAELGGDSAADSMIPTVKAVWIVEGKLIGHFTIEAWRAAEKKTRY